MENRRSYDQRARFFPGPELCSRGSGERAAGIEAGEVDYRPLCQEIDQQD